MIYPAEMEMDAALAPLQSAVCTYWIALCPQNQCDSMGYWIIRLKKLDLRPIEPGC